MTYDEARVSYEDVLDAAFAAAKPVLGLRQYAPIVFASDEAEAERAAAWVAKGGKRDDGLERRQFAVETTDTFWLAEGYHQEYWQKRAAASCIFLSLARRWRGGAPITRQRRWRPRYAALFALVGLQYADSKLIGITPSVTNFSTAAVLSSRWFGMTCSSGGQCCSRFFAVMNVLL